MSRADKIQRLESMLVRVLARKDITRIRPQPAPTGPAPRSAPSRSEALESIMGPAMDLGADDLSEVPTSLIQGRAAPSDDVLAAPEPAFQIEGRARAPEPRSPVSVSEAPPAPPPEEELPTLSDDAPGLALVVEPAAPEASEAPAPQSILPAPEEPTAQVEAPPTRVTEATTVPPAELVEVSEPESSVLIEITDEPAAELIEVTDEPAAELIEVTDEPAAEGSLRSPTSPRRNLRRNSSRSPTSPAAELIEVTDEPAAELIEVTDEPAAEPAAELIEVTDEPAAEPAAELIEVTDEPAAEPAAELIEVTDEPAAELIEVTEEPAAELIEVAEEPAAELIEVAEEPAAELIEVTEEPAAEPAQESVEPEEFDLSVAAALQPEPTRHTPPPLPLGLPDEEVSASDVGVAPDASRIRESIPAPREPESLKPPRDPSAPPAALSALHPEVFASALPEVPGFVSVVAPTAAERPRTLRGMMERALSLRPRR
ncbi:MAG: hypothetical protein R3A48_13150 [Polyangiales bacterium]